MCAGCGGRFVKSFRSSDAAKVKVREPSWSLESNDVITTPNDVVDALAGLSGEFTGELPFPDEIYFVDTASSEDPWWVWLMKYDGKRWHLEDWTKTTEFCVDELTDLTS